MLWSEVTTKISPENRMSFMGEENLSTVFEDLHASAISKAFAVTPQVTNITLGPNSSYLGYEDHQTQVLDLEHSPCSPQIKSTLRNSAQISETPTLLNKLIITKQCKLEKVTYLTDMSVSPVASNRLKPTSNAVPAKKLIADLKTQNRLTVERVMRERISNFEKSKKEMNLELDSLRGLLHTDAITKQILAERKLLEDVEEEVIQNRARRAEQTAQNNLINAQRVNERNQKVKDAEEEARKAFLQTRQFISQILDCQKEFGQEYKHIVETMKTCKDKAALTEVINSQAKELKNGSTGFESLVKKCKSGDVSADDILYAASLVDMIKSAYMKFEAEVVRINDALESEAKKNEERIKEAEQAKIYKQEELALARKAEQAEINRQEESASVREDDLSECFDTESLQRYIAFKTFSDSFEKEFSVLLTDESAKKFRFSCQKAVTIPVNAISPVSRQHLVDKYEKLHSLLSGRRVDVRDQSLSATEHPLGVAFCKNLLARKFVRQGDLAVSSKPDAAFSIAAVIVSLWVDFPDFGQLVLAHFQRECPYLAPVFLPQLEGQSDEDYYKSLGYTYTKTGEVEKQDSFLKRMSGIMRLYAAVLVSNVRQPGKANPLGMTEAWRWLSAILNLQPRPDICATLLFDFLEVAGHRMYDVYGFQFKKMLAYICQEYFPKLEKVTPSTSMGPFVRLEEFLQRVLKVGVVPAPEGLLPVNFW